MVHIAWCWDSPMPSRGLLEAMILLEPPHSPMGAGGAVGKLGTEVVHVQADAE